MKKIIEMKIFNKIIVVLSILVFVILTAILLTQFLQFKNQANINASMDKIKLLIKEEDIKELLRNFNTGHGWGCNPYTSPTGDIRLVFSGYPDVQDSYKLTEIEITNPKYNFTGVHIGRTLDVARNILTKSGFSGKNTNNIGNKVFNKDNIIFYKDKLYVVLTINNESKIAKMELIMESTNKNNIVF